MKHAHHGYLIEPAWFSARETIREVVSIRTWAEIAALALVVFAIFVFAG